MGIFLELCKKQCNESINADPPIGVQTANKYVKTCIKAVYETFMRLDETFKPFHGHVEIFVGEKTNEGEEVTIPNLPLVILEGVSDKNYPPQQKTFLMLKYMYDCYINRFEWFVRAND